MWRVPGALIEVEGIPEPEIAAARADDLVRELARRIPGAWLVVAAGEGVSQRRMLLTHLRATPPPP
jgi:hypothetical protein